MPKLALAILSIAIIVSGLAFIDTMPLGTAQTPTTVNGIITQDTTWTKANSPFSFTGPVKVNIGVTLTIEPGTVLNLNGNQLQVDGTLKARGTNSEPINFVGNNQNLNNGGIDFTSFSSNWNEQNSSGCIIENAVVTSIEISVNNTLPKINHNLIDGYVYSHLTGSPIITNNNFTGTTTDGTAITGGESSLIANNIINDHHDLAIAAFNSAVVQNNTVVGIRAKGINADGSYVFDNVVSGCTEWGISAVSNVAIERNTIANNYEG